MMLLVAAGLFSRAAHGQEAEWIWAPGPAKESVPTGACYFRKTFRMSDPEAGEIIIAADDHYTLYFNNRKLGSGRGTAQLDKYNISRYLNRGKNVLAIKVENRSGETAALVARVSVKESGSEWQSHSSNRSWRTSLRPLPLWHLPIYNDSGWSNSQSFGQLGTTSPWDRAEDVVVQGQTEHKRFIHSQEFEVKRLLEDEQTGSLIAMAFNEFGQIVASREQGPLLLIDLEGEEGPRVHTYSELVTGCQGILCLNGDVYVTGEGPEGLALYRLRDVDRDGTLENARLLCRFSGSAGEHGPHGLSLGPDGMIYVVVGNHSRYEGEVDEESPYANYYEGDLVKPRYEDPGGHAAGQKAPGGHILRVSLDGETVELVAGGLRNCYDLTFNNEGELFVHDSDMESDLGTSWYRPTKVFHIVSGAEYGWRSGWAKWPEYYIDSLPGMVDTGRGSPTGAVAYNHVMFPTRYHNALFLGDWSEGRILAVRMKPQGGTYSGNSEVFLQGSPLNVTDLEVGPDGWLYFITGGRGTSGGLYRIAWLGKVPDAIKNIPEDLSGVIRQPQIHSAWARQRVAGIKMEIGQSWGNQLKGVAFSANNPPSYRIRALDLMQLFGPQPDSVLLEKLSEDQNEQVRAKAASLLGLNADDRSRRALIKLLGDEDRIVRRKACESLVRIGETPDFEDLKRLLISDDRFEVWAARRLLERMPSDDWRSSIMETNNHRLFLQGSVALLTVSPSKGNSYEVLARCSEFMKSFVSDRNFIDMLRVMQLALVRGEVDPSVIPAFVEDVADEFPSGNSIMNRELARLMGYLNVSSIGDRYVEYLDSPSVDEVDKLHLAMFLPFIETEWTSAQRLRMIDYLEAARVREGGGSYEHYVMKACRDFAQRLTEEDVPHILENGARWPNAALIAFYKLPDQLDDTTIDSIIDIDQAIVDEDDDSFDQLKIGIVAVLARSGDERSMEYLRDIWHRDPERRSTVAMGLAQDPHGDNWHLLIASLPVLDGDQGMETLKQLILVNQRPKDAEHYRQVVLLGLRLQEKGAAAAIALLEHWTGEQPSIDGDDWETALQAWQDWYAAEYPDRPLAELPTADTSDKWDLDELMEFLGSDEGRSGSAVEGRLVYERAQCAKCHRFEDQGANIGPDLTKVANRFTRREILESILFPSHVISDQYASETVLTIDGKQHLGLVSEEAGGELLITLSDGSRVTVQPDELDERAPSIISSMPRGLLDDLTQQEIADLFAYLGATRQPRIATGTAPRQNR